MKICYIRLSLLIHVLLLLISNNLSAQTPKDIIYEAQKSVGSDPITNDVLDIKKYKFKRKRGQPKILNFGYFNYTFDSLTWNRYDWFKQYPTGRVVTLNNKKGFIDTTGKVIIPIAFSFVEPFYEPEKSFIKEIVQPGISYFYVKTSSFGKAGIVDENGVTVVDLKNWSTINKDGISYTTKGNPEKTEELKIDAYGNVVERYKQKVKINEQDGKLGLCQNDNCENVEYKYESIRWILKSRGFEAVDTNNNLVLLDDVGNELLKIKKWDIEGYGRYYITQKTKKIKRGLYDLKYRKWTVAPKYDFVKQYSSFDKIFFGYRTKRDYDTLFISDMRGNLIETRTDIHRLIFLSGHTFVGHNTKLNQKVFMDLKSLNTIFEFGEYDDYEQKGFVILVKKNGKVGIYHPYEKVLYPCIIDRFLSNYDSVDEFKIEVDGVIKLVRFENGEYITK